jgi:hypothetical protein
MEKDRVAVFKTNVRRKFSGRRQVDLVSVASFYNFDV